jgi:hypothetical protein
MAEAVYILCFLASALCAILLARSYRATRTRILLWSTLSFSGLALNNALLVIDLLIVPTAVDLSLARAGTALAAIILLLIGLTTEST